jgi:hypothetical protein
MARLRPGIGKAHAAAIAYLAPAGVRAAREPRPQNKALAAGIGDADAKPGNLRVHDLIALPGLGGLQAGDFRRGQRDAVIGLWHLRNPSGPLAGHKNNAMVCGPTKGNAYAISRNTPNFKALSTANK